jgi:hypothetical protein
VKVVLDDPPLPISPQGVLEGVHGGGAGQVWQGVVIGSQVGL